MKLTTKVQSTPFDMVNTQGSVFRCVELTIEEIPHYFDIEGLKALQRVVQFYITHHDKSLEELKLLMDQKIGAQEHESPGQLETEQGKGAA